MGQVEDVKGSDWKAETWAAFWERVSVAGLEPSALFQKGRRKPFMGTLFSLQHGSLVEVSVDKSADGIAGWLRKVDAADEGLGSFYTTLGSPVPQMPKWNLNPVLLSFQEHVFGPASKDWKAYCLDLLNGGDSTQTYSLEFFSHQDWYELTVQSKPIYGLSEEIIGHAHTLYEVSASITVPVIHPEEAVAKQAYEDALLLTKEANHRIKNSLSMAASLLQLQSYALEDEAAKEALGDAVQRLYTVSDLHEALYRHMAGTDKVQIKPFIESLADRLQGLVRARGVEIRTEIQEMDLPNKRASRIGFLINELVLNAAKYAFPDQKQGFVAIYLTQTGGQCYLSVQDNGQGMSPQTGASESLGSTLVAEFAKDLQADVRVETQAGTRYVFTFPA
jgi:two-component sensor histidine kinase